MEIKEEQINNIKVKPVIISTTATNENNLGYSMFPELYSTISILSKKKSGKSNLIMNILKKCVNKNTKVIIFASTVNKDATYKLIQEWLDKKEIEYTAKTNFIEEEENEKGKMVKVNLITQWINQMKQGDDEQQNSESDIETDTDNEPPPPTFKMCLFENVQPQLKPEPEPEPEPKPRKKRKSKYQAPEYLFIFDDLGTSLRDSSISQLCKIMRHFKMKIILSSQRITDLHPDALGQMDYCLIFKSFNDETLDKLREKLDLALDKDEFKKLYEHTTKEKYNFLYIDVNHNLYRKNFNKKIELSQ
jgi:hypothetical protein